MDRSNHFSIMNIANSGFIKDIRGPWLLLVLLAACAGSTTQSRIAKHQKEFDAYPPEIQNKIKAGVVENGFTEEMVALSVGRPDRKYSEKTDKGEVKVWAWTESKGGLGMSVGMGMGTRGGIGTGVSVGTGGGSTVEKRRVEFQDGKVISFSERE